MNVIRKLLNRQFINDPKLQYGITGFFVLLAAINLIFFILLIKIFEFRLYSEISSLDASAALYLKSILKELSSMVLISTTVFGVFIMVFSYLAGILLLQHISGPAFALKEFMKVLLEGKEPRYPLKFRKYDFLSDLAELLNKLYEKYEAKNSFSKK